MPEDHAYQTGCRLTPPPSKMRSIEPLLGAATLPKGFAVSAYKAALSFDANGEVTVTRGKVKIKQQWGRPSCVGQSTAAQKGAQEGKEISARDTYRQAKRLDGSGDPESWGTSLWAGQDALVQGCADEALVPELAAAASTKEYVSLADVTPQVEASREENRSAPTPYTVPRTLIAQTLLEIDIPVVTSLPWYANDNLIGHDGRNIMGLPTGGDPQGHAIAIVGKGFRFGIECLIAVNSWGEGWGCFGFFFIPLVDVINRLGNGYVTVDIKPELAELLARYNGKDVFVRVVRDGKEAQDLYRCELGVLRHYPNELVWWAHGKLFGYDTEEIRSAEFAAMPKGADMRIEDAPFKSRELVRQIRGFYGQH